MLLLSPGDDSASLSIDSSPAQLDPTTDYADVTECDQSSSIASTSKPVLKAVEGDRDVSSVYTSTTAGSDDRAALQPSDPAQLSNYQSAGSRDAYLPETELDGLYALRQSARLRTVRQTQTSSWNRAALATLPESTIENSALSRYAAPLSPLRERDVIALAALFQRDDIYTIEADVSHRLLALLPEPCWEDDVFAFLQEFV